MQKPAKLYKVSAESLPICEQKLQTDPLMFNIMEPTANYPYRAFELSDNTIYCMVSVPPAVDNLSLDAEVQIAFGPVSDELQKMRTSVSRDDEFPDRVVSMLQELSGRAEPGRNLAS